MIPDDSSIFNFPVKGLSGNIFTIKKHGKACSLLQIIIAKPLWESGYVAHEQPIVV